MNDEAAFTRAMQQHPGDNALRLIFADWLEEQGDSRGELIRLLHTLTQSVEVPERRKLEDRLRSLLAAGVQPVGPFWTNSIGMKFAWIPAGTFLMGSPTTERKRGKDESQHRVTLTKGLYVGVHPVTQACWREVMGTNPSRQQGDDLAVENVSWWDCMDFLQKLSGRDGQNYRLPTEAEWEYACRAGTTTPYYFGDTISLNQSNYGSVCDRISGAYRGISSPVGSFPPNGYKVYDMHGNVNDWCADWYGEYPQEDSIDPQGPERGETRVLRGGSFYFGSDYVRSANREGEPSEDSFGTVGFRAARNVMP